MSSAFPVWRRGFLPLLLCVLSANAGESRVVRLQPAATEQAFDGWGSSLCWFANAVGRWPEPQRSEIADALFSSAGLGLTVVRYNIGGGEHPEHHHMPWFRQMEGFQSADGAWRWDADPGQRWMLGAALQRGANRLEAFSNSPPYWMTLSQCVSGGTDPKVDNLDPAQEQAFAEYLAEVVRHFHTAWGIRFDTIEPMNEPYTDYWRANGNQEGCHFDRASQARLIKILRDTLDQRGLESVKIAASDETNYDRSIETWKSFDAPTRADVGQINAHAYATERRSELRALARDSGKTLVMSEVDGGGGNPHDHTGIGPALTLAGQIIDDLRDLQPLRWVFWQAVEDETGQADSNQNWGLIHADLRGKSHTWSLTKKFHVMGQFSKFIRPGALLLASNAADTVAVISGDQKTLIIVARNAQPAEAELAYELSVLGAQPVRVEAYRTSAHEDLAKLPAITATKEGFSATAAAQSVTTYVVTLGADTPSP